MLSDKKLRMKIIITLITYVVFAIIFTKLDFFQETLPNNEKKIDWLKVILISIIPAGLVFYLSNSYFDKYGKFHFSGVDENDNLTPLSNLLIPEPTQSNLSPSTESTESN
jgi:hypothetical protein